MFRSTLTDLIRGLRSNKRNEKKYITGRLEEIRDELRSTDMTRKVNAICKLCYLHMLGYDMGWASFHVIEVMASSDFYWKRQGYLAATQSFNQDTDVLMLTTNLIKKDIMGKDLFAIGVAINGLSHIITPDLARDLCPDILTLTSHGRPSIRKRAVLVLYKICLKYPEALHECVPRLTERLEDTDPSVVSAAVNVIYELARHNPRNYLPLAPHLFRLLTTSSNNWMLIKLIKLFALLTPLEPRLVRKLLPSFKTLIETTPAMSVLYECIRSVVTGGILRMLSENDEQTATELAMLCASKITLFLQDSDQNLKYVGLLVLGDLLEQYPKLVVRHRDLILSCAEDPDLSIRIRALDLVVVLATKRTLMDIVKRLMLQLIPYFMDSPAHMIHDPDFLPLSPLYRTSVIEHIVQMCSQSAYTYVVNFEWYIAVLMDLSRVSGVQVGTLLSDQLIDVAVRVKSVREYCVRMMTNLIEDQALLDTITQPETNIDILWAAAYIIGEYNEYLNQPTVVLRTLGNPLLQKTSPTLQIILIQCILKVYIGWANSLLERWSVTLSNVLEDTTRQVIETLSAYTLTNDLEVKDRANGAYRLVTDLLDSIPKDPRVMISELHRIFFAVPLNPVATRAQRKVKKPDNLPDLDQWIGKPLPDLSNQCWLSDEASDADYSDDNEYNEEDAALLRGQIVRRGKSDPGKEKRSRKKQGRPSKSRAIANPLHELYYIQDTSQVSADDRELEQSQTRRTTPRVQQGADGQGYIDVDTIPVVKLTIQDFNDQWQDIPTMSKKNKKSSRRTRKSRVVTSSSPPAPSRPQVLIGPGEMPEGAELSDEDANVSKAKGNKLKSSHTRHLLGDVEDTRHLESVNITIGAGISEQRAAVKEKKQKKSKQKHAKKTDTDKQDTSTVTKESRRKGKSRAVDEIDTTTTATETTPTAFDMIEPSEPSSLLVVRRKVDKKKKKPTTSTTNVDSATITNESLPSSSSSIPHNSHHETIISSNEIEENEPVLTRSFTLFAQNDHLRLSYELRPLSIADHPITLDPFSQTLVYVTIQLHNKIQDAVIRNIEITLPTRGSIRAMGLSSTQPIIKVSETIDADAKLEHEIKFAIQGPIQSGMTIHGELTYACEYNDKTVSHRHMDWQLAVACADFMIDQSTLPHMTPSEFALALANTDQFTHSASALSIELDRVHSQLEFPILSTIVAERVLHMRVVEVVDESASLYGKSVFGWPIAGLIKRHGHLLAMELKSMDKLFIDGLIEQAEAFFSSH